ncbi:hypothetical protein MMC21_006616 [Puttea exsequens]|nr:hypothetical protein [Puttea exsequens]
MCIALGYTLYRKSKSKRPAAQPDYPPQPVPVTAGPQASHGSPQTMYVPPSGSRSERGAGVVM